MSTPRGAITSALLGRINPAFALNLRAMWDAVNNSWNQRVLNYTQGQQLDLLRRLGFESPSWEDLLRLLIGVIVVASLFGAGWTLWDRHRQDPWLRLLQSARVRLLQAGVPLTPNSPPRTMAEQLTRQLGHSNPAIMAIRDWLLRLEAQRYAHQPDHARPRLATLQREFKQLAWPK
jgi:hypothetical protein